MKRILSILWATVAWASLGAAQATTAGPTVAVLYFDNNTGQKELNALQKGFADMIITDLSTVDNVQVVEREKLEAVLAELKLQNQAYFDPKTALKLGKGLGATHTLAGSFVAFQPRMRIDVRLVDNETGKIVLARQVTGPSSDVFALEQELVGKFVEGLKRTFVPAARPQTQVRDLDVLLTYSKGIDLADRKNYEEAAKLLALTVTKAPTFALARVRSTQILDRLNQARTRREQELVDAAVVLASHADAILKAPLDGQDAARARTRLAYRYLRGCLLEHALRPHVSSASPSVVLIGHEKKALDLIRAYTANSELLLTELAEYARRHTQTSPSGFSYLDTSFGVPADDAQRARDAKLRTSVPTSARQVRAELAELLLVGRTRGVDDSYTVAPTPANLLAKLKTRGFQLLEENVQEALAAAKSTPAYESDVISALDDQAEALLLHGEREKAIGKWQEILDRFPTSTSFQRYEQRIQKELGVVYDHHVAGLGRYEKGLKGCDDMDLRVGLGAVVYDRTRVLGRAAMTTTVAEIEKACRANRKAKSFWPYLYSHAALFFAQHGDCNGFDTHIARHVAEGGSQSDANGYRKNWTKCPAP